MSNDQKITPQELAELYDLNGIEMPKNYFQRLHGIYNTLKFNENFAPLFTAQNLPRNPLDSRRVILKNVLEYQREQINRQKIGDLIEEIEQQIKDLLSEKFGELRERYGIPERYDDAEALQLAERIENARRSDNVAAYLPGSNELRPNISAEFNENNQLNALILLNDILNGEENKAVNLMGVPYIKIKLLKPNSKNKIFNNGETFVRPLSSFRNRYELQSSQTRSGYTIESDFLNLSWAILIKSNGNDITINDPGQIAKISVFWVPFGGSSNSSNAIAIRNAMELNDIPEKDRTESQKIAANFFNALPIPEDYKPTTPTQRKTRNATARGAFFPYKPNRKNMTAEELEKFEILAAISWDSSGREYRKNCAANCFEYYAKNVPGSSLSPELVAHIFGNIAADTFVTKTELREISEKFGLNVKIITEGRGGNTHNNKSETYKNNPAKSSPDVVLYFSLFHYIPGTDELKEIFRKFIKERKKYLIPLTSQEIAELMSAGETLREWMPCANDFKQLIKPNEENQKSRFYKIYAADFETTFLEGSELVQHKAFLGYIYDGTKFMQVFNVPEFFRVIFDDFEKFAAIYNKTHGEQNKQILKGICYFHNLNFDGSLLIYDSLKNIKFSSVLDKGNKIISFKATRISKGKKPISITFKDSFRIIPVKLAKFSQMFQISDTVKEVMPYHLYTRESVKNKQLNEPAAFREYVTGSQWFKDLNDEDRARFLKNSEGLGLIDYAAFYCRADVLLLWKGLSKMRETLKELTGLKMDDFNTIPGIAYATLKKEVLEKLPNYYEYSGTADAFIRSGCVGGRVSTLIPEGEKHAAKCKICRPLVDFDAVSLYPSAMTLLKIPLGVPIVEKYKPVKILKEIFNDLQQFPFYVMRFNILPGLSEKIPHYSNPFFCRKDSAGVLDWSDYFDESTTMTMGKTLFNELLKIYGFTLLDFIEVNYVYKWEKITENAPLSKIIKHFFNKRKECKKNGNTAMAEVLKLLLNSGYGKFYQALQLTKTRIIENSNGEGFDWIARNFPAGSEFVEIGDETTERKQIKVKISNNTATQYRDTVLGLMVLEYSKLLMLRVMHLAECYKIPIFYQDTDSMHIAAERLDELAKLYHEKYGRELIGADLLQFHSDFEPNDGTKLEPGEVIKYARRSIFLGKKAYCDELETNRGRVCYMYRMKGITLQQIREFCRVNKITIFEFYEKLAAGEKIKINIAELNPLIKIKDYRIFTLNNYVKTMEYPGRLFYLS